MPQPVCLPVTTLTPKSIVLCMPQEIAGKPEINVLTHHCLSIASAYIDNSQNVPCVFDHLDGHPQIARTMRGLPKLNVQIDNVTVLRPRSFNTGQDDSKQRDMSMGVLFDIHDTQHNAYITALRSVTSTLQRLMLLSDDIRNVLKINFGVVTEDNVDVLAQSLDGMMMVKQAAQNDDETLQITWCWPKVNTRSGWTRSVFFSPASTEISIDHIKQWHGRIACPSIVLCIDSVFASCVYKSLRVRVVEAILVPPTESPQATTRRSLLFPDTIIAADQPADDNVQDEKRQKIN